MATALLLAFVAGLALLPFLYLQRSRRAWQVLIRAEGVATQARVVGIQPLRLPRRGPSKVWSELCFEYRPEDHDESLRVTVHVRTTGVTAAGLSAGHTVPIHYRKHVPTEAVVDGLDCRPSGI